MFSRCTKKLPHYLTLFVLSVCLHSPASAQEKAATPSTGTSSEKKDYIVVRKADEIVADSSEHNRIDKNYAVELQVLGIGWRASSSGAGISGGWFIDRNQILYVDFASSSALGGRTSSSSTWGSKYDTKATALGVRYKNFFSNSFYGSVGLSYNSVKFNYSYKSSVSSSFDVDRSFDGQSTDLNIAIGNQWQFTNFTIGCDWFGYQIPLQSSTTNSVVSGPGANSGDVSDQDTDMNIYVRKPIPYLTRFYLGWSF